MSEEPIGERVARLEATVPAIDKKVNAILTIVSGITLAVLALLAKVMSKG